MRRTRAAVLFVATAALMIMSASPGVGQEAEDPAGPPSDVAVLVAHGGGLLAVDTGSYESQLLIDPADGEVQGEVCFDPDAPRTFAIGTRSEDSAGWAIYELSGAAVGSLTAERIAEFEPTHQGAPRSFGCVFLPDGRLATTSTGGWGYDEATTGELLLWFPPFDGSAPRFCKLVQGMGTAGGVALDADGSLLVVDQRPDRGQRTGGVYRVTGDLPTSPDAAGGCGGDDGAGGPLVDDGRLSLETFIALDQNSQTPTDLAPTAAGTWLVSNIYTGYLHEYDADGAPVRRIAQPGSTLPDGQLEAFTPYGIVEAPDGSIWVAHHGLQGTSPSDGGGQLIVVRFGEDGAPMEKERIVRDLQAPDGIAVIDLTTTGEVSTAAQTDVRAAPTPLPTTGGGAALAGVALLMGVYALRRRSA